MKGALPGWVYARVEPAGKPPDATATAYQFHVRRKAIGIAAHCILQRPENCCTNVAFYK